MTDQIKDKDMDKDKDKDKTVTSRTTKNRVDYPRKTDQEEFGAEVAPVSYVPARDRDVSRDRDVERSDTAEGTAGRTVGYVGVGLGIASLFFWSVILGPLAAIMGFYAYSQGNKTSGAWAIGLGVVSTLSYFVLLPFTR